MMNFIEGEIGGDALFRAGGQALVCDVNGSKRNAPAVLAVRPENIRLVSDGGRRLPVRSSTSPIMGSIAQLHVKTALSDAPLQVRVAATGPDAAAARTGG